MARLREYTAFKALELLLDEARHINMPPNPPIRAGRSYLRAVLYHLAFAYIHLLFIDISTYPAYRLAPDSFGSPHLVGGDFGRWCTDLASSTGIPRPMIWSLWALNIAMTVYQGMASVSHTTALVAIASGVYLDEEWPKVLRKPWLSTSLNELWSKRYHQTLRVSYPPRFTADHRIYSSCSPLRSATSLARFTSSRSSRCPHFITPLSTIRSNTNSTLILT